ncbi:MAG: hypothetical protein RLZZ455_1068 [Candidatus Parcubacteria bacterium]|jgi:hypothetical protein
MNKALFFLCISAFLVGISFVLPGYFSSADTLMYLPSFDNGSFLVPKNSLLFDPVVQFEPWRVFAKEEFVQGRIPFWNPHNASGVPFLANPQSSVYFPLQFLYYFLPTSVSLYSIHLIKLFSVGFFMCIYLREMQRTWLSSVLGGVVVASSGFFITWLQWPHTNVLLFFPLLLFLTEKVLHQKYNSYQNYVYITITYFLAILGGHPETLFHVFLLHMAYAVLRLHAHKKKLFFVFLSFIVSMLLASFVLFPFVEYLLHSTVLLERGKSPVNFYLSPIGVIQFIFPFVFGAPHLSLYRSIHQETNFQEGIGGYVGAIVFVFACIGFFTKRKSAIVKFWAIFFIVVLLLAYKIFPFTLINQLPIFSLSVNVRLLGFLSFGLVTIFCFVLDDILLRPCKNNRTVLKVGTIILSCISLLIIGADFLLPIFTEGAAGKWQIYLHFLSEHLLIVCVSSLLFLLGLLRKPFDWFSSVLLSSAILVQTVFFFWNYNPVIEKAQFYPETELTTLLKTLPPGPIIEVGNMNLPENINLSYGLEHVRSYDAIDVGVRSREVDSLFYEENRWGRIEHADADALTKIGVKYILSDYDIRFVLSGSDQDPLDVLPLHGSLVTQTTLVPKSDSVMGLRMMFATHNRKNNCNLELLLREKATERKLFTSRAECTSFSNFMYYVFDIPPGILKKHTPVILTLRLRNADSNNFISAVGQGDSPYVAQLIKVEGVNRKASLINRLKGIYVFSLSGDALLTSKDTYQLIKKEPTEIEFIIESTKAQQITLFSSNFPGWEVYVNGHLIPHDSDSAFIRFMVPKGDQIVRVVYHPLSFILGVILSLATLCIAGIILLRRSIHGKRSISLVYLRGLQELRVLQIPWYSHLFVFAIGIVISSLLYLAVIRIWSPTFIMPESQTINWYTVHKYPRQQDYFYFATSFLSITVGSVIFWLLWLWKIYKKGH